jgi:hypothetical protein
MLNYIKTRIENTPREHICTLVKNGELGGTLQMHKTVIAAMDNKQYVEDIYLC